MAGTIRILPSDVADKIAAGEVIQRPASAVKELMENAIDAEATSITVVVRDAGTTLVHVVDDGTGIPADEVHLAFQRHATSKITRASDLENIRTLGFRGEALASIASVSRLEVRTRTRSEEVGTSVLLEGGNVTDRSSVQTAIGTSIAVKNLFYNTPARRKFLKSPATELRHISDAVTRIALAYPEIAIRYVSNDEELLLSASTDGAGRLRDVFGDRFAQHLFPFRQEAGGVTLEGYLGTPAILRKTRSEQFFYLNRRFVLSRAFQHAVFQAYEHLLEKGSFPFYLLSMTVDPRTVDVNVHPSKLEVKFENESDLYKLVLSAVRKALAQHDLVPVLPVGGAGQRVESAFSPPVAGLTLAAEWKSARQLEGELPGLSPSLPAQGSSPVSGLPARASPEGVAINSFQVPGVPASPRVLAHQAGTGSAEGDSRAIWQIHNKYILSQIKTGLMIVDQHVAHERILYERALSNFRQNLPVSQQLLFPQTFELTPGDFAIVKELLPHLERLGFAIRPFGRQSVIVEGIPADVRVGNEADILRDLLEEYKNNEHAGMRDVRDNLAKSFACKAAIKAGDRLGTAEMISLIDQLFATSMPYVCPHGRPVVVKVTIDELDNRFGRT